MTTDPNALFGELRALLQDLSGSPEHALAFFDAHAVGAPEHARGVWLPYAVEHLSREANGLDEVDGIPFACAVAALTRWVGHEALAPVTLPDAFVLEGEPDSFAPFTFCASLLELFWRHGSFQMMGESRLPDELMSYLSVAKGRWWSADSDNPYATKLYYDASIIRATGYELDCWEEDREDAGGGRIPGAWISIGDWSDKHITTLCCDKHSAHFGGVYDFHDAHPWLNGEDSGYREADSLMAYVRSLAG